MRSIRLTEYFVSLAKGVNALYALPKRNGAIEFKFDSSGKRFIWYSDNNPQYESLPGNLGSWSSTGLEQENVKKVIDYIASLKSKKGVWPFSPRPNEKNTIELSKWFIKSYLTKYFEEGRTAWNDYLLVETRDADKDTVFLVFRNVNMSGKKRPFIIFHIFPYNETGDCKIKTLPFGINIAYDCRSDQEKTDPFHDIETYLSYSLSRVFLPEQKFKVIRHEQGEDHTPDMSGTETEEIDRRDSIPENAFMLKERQIGAMYIMNAIFNSDSGVEMVTYLFRACFKLPIASSVNYSGHLWAPFYPSAFSITKEHIKNMLPVGEIDLITGNDEQYRQQLEEAVARDDVEIIFVFSSCVADLVGFDLEGIAREIVSASGKQVIFWRAASQQLLQNGARFWEQIFSIADENVVPEDTLINLVGFAPNEHPVATELSSDLKKLGVDTNGFCIPTFKTFELKRFHRAKLNVISNDEMTADAFRRVGSKFSEKSKVVIDPPFGPGKTLHFYKRILIELGLDEQKDLLGEIWQNYTNDWHRLTKRAEKHEVAIVVDQTLSHNLLNPKEMYGMDIVALLAEMGFGVRILVIPDKDDIENNQLAKQLKTHWPLNREKYCVEVLDVDTSLHSWLKNGKFSLVYSEYVPDRRVLDAGKQAINSRDFEMGFAGALRSIVRVVRIAESCFFKTFS